MFQNIYLTFDYGFGLVIKLFYFEVRYNNLIIDRV